MDQSVFQTALADSPKDYAEPATRILQGIRSSIGAHLRSCPTAWKEPRNTHH